MREKRGFTLIELVLVIGIAALLIMAIGLTSGVRENAKVHSAAESIRSLRSAAENYIAAGNMTFIGISIDDLKTKKFLPDSFSAIASNSWGGDFNIVVNSGDSSKVEIKLTNVSSDGGVRLNALFKNSASSISYDAATKEWTGTF